MFDSYKESRGFISGKFVKRVTPIMYKFLSDGGYCYVMFKNPIQLDDMGKRITMKVMKRGLLAGLPRYKILWITKFGDEAKKRNTLSIKETARKQREVLEQITAFSEGKYYGASHKPMAANFADPKEIMKYLKKKAKKESKDAV